MKKTGKALIGVLSVAALVGTGVATWTINGGIITETTDPITPTIAEIGTRDIAIDVTEVDNELVFDNPHDLEVIYNVKAKAGTGAAAGFEPYGYDFKNIVPEYQPNLSITTQVLRDGSPIDESDPFFDFVEVPSDESETKISYLDWLNVDLKDKGYNATLTFAWGAETGGLNPQEYVVSNSSTYNTPELQREFFERVNAALDKITFTFTFKVGGLKDTPVETPETGEITIPTVEGSTLTIDGMTGTTVEAGTHRITITTEEGKEVNDKKLTVIENGTTKNDVTLTEETLTRASAHTYYADYEFKADTTYSFEYTLKDEEVPPTLYIVTYTQPENGTITLKNGDTDVTTGAQVEGNTNLTLTVTANEGYHITSILVNGAEAGTDYTTTFTKEIPVTANLTISATMEKDAPVVEKFAVTYEAIENGTIELENGNETVTSGTEIEKGTELSLTVTANDGYEITSILVNAEELNAEKTYESPYTTSLTINEATTIKVTIEEVIDYSIGQVTEVNQTYTVRGKVVAKNTQALVISDGNDSIYLYDRDLPSQYEIGDFVEATGKVTSYNKAFQMSYNGDLVVTKIDEQSYTFNEPTTLTSEIVESWITAENFATSDIKEYTWQSTATKLGNYFELKVAGSDTSIQPVYIDSSLYNIEEGKTYNVTAYFVGYYNYANIVITSLEEIEPTYDPVESVKFTNAETELEVGKTLKLTSEVLPVTANQEVTYSITSGSDYATLEGDVLTGVAEGEVTVTVTTKGLTSSEVSTTNTKIINIVKSEEPVDESKSSYKLAVGEKNTTISKVNALAKFTNGIQNGEEDIVTGLESYDSTGGSNQFLYDSDSHGLQLKGNKNAPGGMKITLSKEIKKIDLYLTPSQNDVQISVNNGDFIAPTDGLNTFELDTPASELIILLNNKTTSYYVYIDEVILYHNV